MRKLAILVTAALLVVGVPFGWLAMPKLDRVAESYAASCRGGDAADLRAI